MARICFFCLLIVMVLSACTATLPPAPTPSETVLPEPSATPAAVSSTTQTPLLPTVPPQPTSDPNFFRDDFLETLDAQWAWVREDPENWSLAIVPGALQINVDNGYVLAHSNSNLLLRPAPEGNFQIETRVTFDPRHNFETAGLIIYESDTNFVHAGHGFCSSVGCVGEGLYMNTYRRGIAVKPNVGQVYLQNIPVFLRLSRRGDRYTFENSEDGRVWFLTGSHTTDIDPLQIGLVASQNLRGDLLPALFDYFEVRSLP